MSKDLVQVHFDRTAETFDSIYTGRKSAFSRFLDKKLRWDMEKRFERTIEECGEVNGKTIIDVGCGSGRFMEALQVKHPGLILGLDFAPTMLSLAQKILFEKMPDSPCRFVVGDYNQVNFKQNFDITLAIGLFDYIAEPLPMLKKMRQTTDQKLIATFPRKGTLRAILRNIRLSLHNCPVFFFTPDEVNGLLKNAGFTEIKQEIFGQLIFITAM
jgi:ubiquinone/menaquinone biosynthesis C-methylase UbiE